MDEDQAREYLSKQDIHKSMGTDMVYLSAEVLSELADVIAKLLLVISQ